MVAVARCLLLRQKPLDIPLMLAPQGLHLGPVPFLGLHQLGFELGGSVCRGHGLQRPTVCLEPATPSLHAPGEEQPLAESPSERQALDEAILLDAEVPELPREIGQCRGRRRQWSGDVSGCCGRQ